MEIIFNELSIQTHANSVEQADNAMFKLMEMIKSLKDFTKTAIVLKRIKLFDGCSLAEDYFYEQWKTKIHGLGKQNPQLKNYFLLFLNALDKGQIIHDYPYYHYQERECNGLGYAYENDIFAVSCDLSEIWDKTHYELRQTIFETEHELTEEVVEVKHLGENAHIQGIHANNILNYLERVGKIRPYNCNSKISPRDNETILFDEKVFAFTGKSFPFGKEKKVNRKIYRKREDGTYWYVDNLHYGCAQKDGKGAHLEVFGSNGNHIGIADINTGFLDETKKEKDRSIKKYI